jgi:hypothetical protein
MNRRDALAALGALAAAWLVPAHAASAGVHVFKNPDCGCCTAWVKHLQAAAFDVLIVDREGNASAYARYPAA